MRAGLKPRRIGSGICTLSYCSRQANGLSLLSLFREGRRLLGRGGFELDLKGASSRDKEERHFWQREQHGQQLRGGNKRVA